VSHGSSNANAIKNAIRVAAEFSKKKLNHTIEVQIQAAAHKFANGNGKAAAESIQGLNV
jgi:glycerol-3-phosphate acyltransferase PlsX